MRSLAAEAVLPQCQLTLPSGLADAGLALAVTSFGGAAVSQAVGDVTGFPFPVGLALAVHRTGGVPHAALATAGAVVGTCVHPGREERRREVVFKSRLIQTLNKTSGTSFNGPASFSWL